MTPLRSTVRVISRSGDGVGKVEPCTSFLLLLILLVSLLSELRLFLSWGLALPVRHQEDHGFLFANLGHDGRQLVEIAAVEMLRFPQVQDH